jgi:hypothetical protein
MADRVAAPLRVLGPLEIVREGGPVEARALLAEALELETTFSYESPQELLGAVFGAARLEDWSTTLRVAERALLHHIRSGALGIVYVAATLNVTARGLAEHRRSPPRSSKGPRAP